MSSILNATTTTGLAISPDNSGSLQLATNNGTTAVTIDTSQRVGIGTSSPSTKLQVSGAASTNATSRFVAKFTDTSAVALGNGGGIMFQGVYTGTTALDCSGIQAYKENATDGNYAYAMTFATRANGGDLTERMRITSGGNVLIGKSADNDTTLGVRVISGIVNSAGSSDFWNSYSTTASVYRFYVTNGGTVTATNTTISAISDQRFKENIVDLDVGLDAVMALKPRKFDWKTGKGKDIKGDRGFIAQEFEQIFPDLIDEWKDPAPEGEEPYKAVRQDLIPVLVKAIQELKAELDATKAEVQALKGVA